MITVFNYNKEGLEKTNGMNSFTAIRQKLGNFKLVTNSKKTY